MQALALDWIMPAGRSRLRPGRLTWSGTVHPGSGSDEYELRLEARPATPPSIFVVAPALQTDANGQLPHVYDDRSLCLSQAGDWRPHMLFIETFLPWSCEWLIQYELWTATSVWYGDGLDILDEESQARILHPYD